jgi:hypothetical protein
VLKRLRALPGFGEQKAKIFLALLGKQYGFTGAGWREASAPYGEAIGESCRVERLLHSAGRRRGGLTGSTLRGGLHRALVLAHLGE